MGRPIKNYKKAFWKVFSEYIRKRDKYVCISCGKQLTKETSDAGHYIPKTAGLTLYFDERNVHAQCTHCNRFMHGNLAKYALALIRKYGQDILEKLDMKRNLKVRYTDFDYQVLIKEYKKKIKDLTNVL